MAAESQQANTQNKQPTNPNSALLAQLLLLWTGMISMATGATPRAADGEKAKRDGEVMCWPTELDNWPVCDRCGNDPRERKVTVECAWKNHYLCFWCWELLQSGKAKN